jgi:bisphosphoglycerate-dependent phosphoglycerate mutase
MKNDIKLLIIIRHGERTDRVGEIPKCGILNPELTEKGKQQSFIAGKLTLETIKKYGIKDISPNLIEIRTSPYMRTIQTSIQILKGFNLSFINNNKLNKVYIDFDLKKRIKPNKKIDQNELLYKTVDTYANFDNELNNIEFLGDKGDFSLEPETSEQCEKRSFKYVDTIIKNSLEKSENKILIIVGHRGSLKYILKKLGYKIIEKKILDYCSQFFFDVRNGIDNAIFLENLQKPKIEI